MSYANSWFWDIFLTATEHWVPSSTLLCVVINHHIQHERGHYSCQLCKFHIIPEVLSLLDILSFSSLSHFPFMLWTYPFFVSSCELNQNINKAHASVSWSSVLHLRAWILSPKPSLLMAFLLPSVLTEIMTTCFFADTAKMPYLQNTYKGNIYSEACNQTTLPAATSPVAHIAFNTSCTYLRLSISKNHQTLKEFSVHCYHLAGTLTCSCISNSIALAIKKHACIYLTQGSLVHN